MSGAPKQQVMTDQRIQQAIDACRPGGDDLQLPEVDFLAEAVRTDLEVRRTFERSQQFDAAVSSAFREVPVPAGLAERLLAAVETSAGTSPDAPLERPSPPSLAGDSDPDLKPRRRWTRGIHPRAWAVMAGSLAVTAVFAGILLVAQRFKGLEPTVGEQLPGEVLRWVDAIERQGWNDNLQAVELHDYPLDRAVRTPRRWCQIVTAYDSQTVVYDLAPSGGGAAFVFCMRSKARNSALPDTPWTFSSATGGKTLGVWRRGDMVYVLMVHGGPRRYREFLETSPLIGFRSRIGYAASPTGKA